MRHIDHLPATSPRTPVVDAVVVTYRRRDVLTQTLAAVRAQVVGPRRLIVVDNDPETDDGTRAAVVAAGGDYVASPGNLGYGAGITLGIEYARSTEPRADAYWVLDDDSQPALDSLVSLLPHLKSDVGLIAFRGGHIRLGRIRHTLHHLPAGVVSSADFTLIDGTLVNGAAIDAAGLPRTDLFMMLEDFEYSTRVRQCGFRLLVVGGDSTTHGYMGSAAPWRHYYQSRNLLRIAIDRRSPSLALGWVAREAGILLRLVLRREFEKVRLRLRGALDGLRGIVRASDW